MGDYDNHGSQQTVSPAQRQPTIVAGPPPQVHATSTVSIWDQIKRHKVVEWTLAYIAFAYALLHGVEMLRDAFEWSSLVPRVTVIVLLVGIPVAATLAWFHGHRAQHRVSGAELAILIALLVVAGSILWGFSQSIHQNTTIPVSVATVAGKAAAFAAPARSVAVLGFRENSRGGGCLAL